MRHDHHVPKSHTPWLLIGISGLFLARDSSSRRRRARPDRPARWAYGTTTRGKGAVEIRPCGETGRDADHLCGFIVWLKDPNNKNGEPLDRRLQCRPEKAQAARSAACPFSDHCVPCRMEAGTRAGSTTPSRASPSTPPFSCASRRSLVLTGYKGIKFFSKSFVWKRAPDDLPRCDDSAAIPARGARPAPARRPPCRRCPDKRPLRDRRADRRAGRCRRPVPAVRVRPAAAAMLKRNGAP